MDNSAADRERVADYVRRALPRELAHREISWPHVLAYDAKSIRLTLTRGALLIPAVLSRGADNPLAWTDLPEGEDGRWWEPATREWAQELTRRLVHMVWLRYLPFAQADEAGRLHVRAWRDGNGYAAEETEGMEPVVLELAPGYQLERSPEGGLELRRFLDARPVRLAAGLQEGLVRVDG